MSSISLVKQPNDEKLYTFDMSVYFTDRPDSAIATVSVPVGVPGEETSSDLTFGDPIFSGTTIQMLIGGGGSVIATKAELYKITFFVSTQYDPSVEVDVYMTVVDL